MPRWRILGLLIFLSSTLSGTRPAFAQIQPNPGFHPQDRTPSPDLGPLVGFDAMSQELADKLVKAGHRKVIVFGFLGPDKYWSPFADWLADQFSLALQRASQSLKVVDGTKLPEYDAIEENQFGTGTAKIRLALELGADTLIDGTYRPAENGVGVSLDVHFPVIHPSNAISEWTSPTESVRGKILFSKGIGSKVYLPLDALWPESRMTTPGEAGVGHPSCIYCPNPTYSAKAHKERLEGTVVLLAEINTEGRVSQARVIKGLGSGLDEEAIEAVKSWRLKPATDVDGRPVPVYIPLELSFHLY